MISPDRRRDWAIALALFAGTFLYRILEPIFHNDHFEYFALATEMLHGAVPGVDFFDPSRPLQYTLTAFGLLFGHQLLAEAAITITALSVASVLIYLLGARITGSRLLGVFGAVVVIAALPRLYSYPKILVPALSLLLWRNYAAQPSGRRLALVSLATILGFYFRFDYLAWIGLATASGLAVMHWRSRRPLITTLSTYAATVALFCAPYGLFQVVAGGVLTSGPSTGRLTRVLQGEDVVAFEAFHVPSEGPLFSLRSAGPLTNVHWKPGLTADTRAQLEQRYGLEPVRSLDADAWQYVMRDQSAATLRRLLADPMVDGTTNIDDNGGVLREPPWVMVRRWLHIPVVESPLLTRENATIWLYCALFFTPVAALIVVMIPAVRRRAAPADVPTVVATIVMAALFNVFLIRGNADSRVPDVIVPNVILWVWLWRVSLTAVPSAIAVAGTAAVAWSLLLALDLYSGSLDHLGATELFSTPIKTARHLKYAIVGLLHPLDRFAPAGSKGLPALVRYVNRCTAPTDRLLVLGYQPEFFFYSDRRVGGGNPVYQSNLGAAPAQQRQIVAWLQQERVPVVLLPMNRLFDIDATYGIVKAYVDSRYMVAAESGFGEGRAFRVLVDPRIVPDHVDPELGLPCYAS